MHPNFWTTLKEDMLKTFSWFKYHCSFLSTRYVRSQSVLGRPAAVWTSISRSVLPHRYPFPQSQNALSCDVHIHPYAGHLGHVSGHVHHQPLPHLPASAVPRIHPEPKRALPDQQHAVPLLRSLIRVVPVLNGAGRRSIPLQDAAALH